MRERKEKKSKIERGKSEKRKNRRTEREWERK